MEKNTVLSPKDVLASIYDAEPADLQLAITLNPDVERIAQAMESYRQQFQSPAPLSAATELRLCGDVSREEIERLSEDYAESVISEDATATYTAAQAYHHVKRAYKMALLSQRQPVAPEREEADREKALGWWYHTLNAVTRMTISAGRTIPTEKIVELWRKETSPSAENKGKNETPFFCLDHGLPECTSQCAECMKVEAENKGGEG